MSTATTQRRPSSSPYLLSPGGYDDDASPIRALSDQESDSEDDQLMEASRSTLDLVQHDRTVLEEEEERERLLIRAKSSPTDGLRRIFGATPHDNGSFSVKIGKRDRRRRRNESAMTRDRRRRRSSAQSNNDAMNIGEEDELMYEMEEGVCKAIESDDDSRSMSTISSISIDLDPRVMGNGGHYGNVRLGPINITKSYHSNNLCLFLGLIVSNDVSPFLRYPDFIFPAVPRRV